MMMTFQDMRDAVTEREPLARHTWFGLGGPAEWFARPRSVDQFAALVRRCYDEGIPLRMLGLGANLLVSDDGVPGMVVRLNAPEFRRIAWPDADPASEEVTVHVAGGADMSRLALDAVRAGWAGLECMAGIPGSMGGIIRMNAGGRFGQISDVVESVTIVNERGEVETLTPREVGFRYRHTKLDGKYVCAAALRLKRDDPDRLRRRFMEIWDYKKQTQPLADNSAGCIFKNPADASAGRLIEEAGLKGRASGGAFVSPKHANFIVVKEGATARDVLSLIGLIRREVAGRFGVELELEVEVWDAHHARRPEEIGEPA